MMDDDCSIMSGSYWDATSRISESTIPTEEFLTPHGSVNDVSSMRSNADTDTASSRLSPVFNDMCLSSDQTSDMVTVIERHNSYEIDQMSDEIKADPPPTTASHPQIALSPSEEIKKRSWKHSFSRRFSLTKSKIFRSFSKLKTDSDSSRPRSILSNIRHSIRRIKSIDVQVKKRKSDNGVRENESVSALIGSDCEYFNFEPREAPKDSEFNESENEVVLRHDETPIKPRRQYSQDRYLTGSSEVLKKMFNSLNRKSGLQENKSLFDLCSTVSYIFEKSVSSKIKSNAFIHECVDTFLKVNKQQIHQGLININKSINKHIDLYSDNLTIREKSKKYVITELRGSSDVCVINNILNKRKFVALKNSETKQWISFTSFSPDVDDEDLFRDQKWVCYSAQSITNFYLEQELFKSNLEKCSLILQTMIQLIPMLFQHTNKNRTFDFSPTNILIISSNLSIIFVYNDSEEVCRVIESRTSFVSAYGTENSIETYQQYRNQLYEYVQRFLLNPQNAYHLIAASYPLDYLFYVLMKLSKDVSTISNSS